MKQKRHMTHDEEFDIMKLVLDKFLWLGVGIMGLGFYRLVTPSSDVSLGFMLMGAGAVILVLFAALLVKEYNFINK